ncbi:hypothetical protein ARMGADRAFT_1014516 [Armillaria gallica]|uniref:Uncharacterized protein n=1 Tax=Armillaria gallica TaxID=47427 RepID=A0A2H3DTS9_ARMGA|nr:hypothetical protein ARMGADRAFT_1014516 [Armillaria gallica]
MSSPTYSCNFPDIKIAYPNMRMPLGSGRIGFHRAFESAGTLVSTPRLYLCCLPPAAQAHLTHYVLCFKWNGLQK